MKTAHKLLALLLALALLMALAPAVLAENDDLVTDVTDDETAAPNTETPSLTDEIYDIIDIDDVDDVDEAALPDEEAVAPDASDSISETSAALTTEASYSLRITGQPSDFTGNVGSTATFTVKARGLKVSYSWQYSTDGGKTWQKAYLGGSTQTAETLSVTIYSHRDGYMFRCVVSDVIGNSSTSSTAALHAVTAADIVRQPSDIGAFAGEAVAFSVEADGSDLGYQWQYSANGESWSDVAVSSYDTPVLEVSVTTPLDGFGFRCVVTSASGGTSTSDAAFLSVGQAAADVKFVKQPSDASASAGDTVTFAVSVTGSVSAYQWQYRTSGDEAWSEAPDDSGAATLEVDAETSLDDSEFRCVVTDGDGNMAASKTASLQILSTEDAVTITADPADITVEENADATFSISASGAVSACQWQFSTDGGTSWRNIRVTGYDTPSLTITAYAFYDGYMFRCVVTDELGNTAASAGGLLTVASGEDESDAVWDGANNESIEEADTLPVLALEILSDPEDVTADAGDKVTFSIEALGENLTYQWKVSANKGSSWTNVTRGSGYKTDTLTLTAESAYNGCLFRCVVTDGSGSAAISDTALLTVTSSTSSGVTITTQPVSVTAASGSAAVFTIVVSGDVAAYQWQFSANGSSWQDSAFQGYDTATLTVTATTALNGYYYRCVVTSTGGTSVTSGTAKLTVKASTGGTVYYVSATGTSSTGTSPDAPMSLETANSIKYYGGDQLLFKCDDVFYGEISPKMRGDGTDGTLVISCYGDGALPVITSAKVISSSSAWSKYATNIWRVNLTDTSKFSGYTATDEDSCNIGHIQAADGTIFGGLCTSTSEMSDEMDFYCNGKYLYVYTKSNPYTTYGTLRCATNLNGLLVPNYCDVSNLEIRNTGACAVRNRSYPIVNANVHDLVVNVCGGSLQYGIGSGDSTRYGAGMEIWGNSASRLNTNVRFYNNLVMEVFDSGITIQGNTGAYSNIYIYNNILVRCSGSFEFWTHGSSDSMSGIYVYDNYTVQAGGGWADTYRSSRWFGDFTFGKFASGTTPQITFTGNVSIDPYRIFRFTTALPSGQKITWSGNTVYTGDSLVYCATHVSAHSYTLSDALSLYKTMTTWTGKTLTSKQQSLLNSAVLFSTDYSAIRSFLVSNF